jgi:hypothetical protein
MSDVSSIPFINFGLSQAQQGQTNASANLQNQEANLTSQQATQAQMRTQLMQKSMPLYLQTISDMVSDMSGTTTANASEPTGYGAARAQASADQSGTAPGSTPGSSTPSYADPGAIAETARQQNYIQPFTPQEQKALQDGALFASMPGGSAGFLNMAKMRQQFRVANQQKQNQYQSGQLYDVMTAVQDPSNQDPMGMLRAAPGQQAIVAQIAADHPGDDAAQADAARKYAQMYAFNLHQYTGRAQSMQNGVLVDTTVGAPVTGQDQVLTGLTPELRSKAMQWAHEPIPVKLTTGDTIQMPRDKAPVAQGGLGMTAEAYVARQDAIARAHLNNPNAPSPGATTWDAPAAIGNTSGAQAAKQGNATRPAPTAASSMPQGARPAAGPALHTLRQQQASSGGVQTATDQVPSPTTAIRGPVPPTGTPAYNNRLTAALNDSSYKARWNIQPQPGMPIPGASTGVTAYQQNRDALTKDSSEMAQSADQALQNFQAAKLIYDSANSSLPLTGPIGALEQKIAASLGLDWRAPATRQEVAKYLTNGAVAGLKQTYGSRPGVFDVKINVEKAFPNIDSMSPPAVRNLTDSQISQAQYIKDSAVRAKAYANRGLEPTQFGTWNSTYFPRSELFDTTYGKQPSGGTGQTQINSPAQYAALPRGARYVDPNGVARVKQ